MKHRFTCATVLVLLLGGGSSALAFPRVASFDWSPATGPVAGYAVYASIGGSVEELVAAVAVPRASIDVESSVYVSVRVAAYDGAGRLGPFSDPAPLVRLCPGDFDGDEVIEMTDWTAAWSCFAKPGLGFCAGADLDFDGWVGITDLQSMSFGSDACALTATPTVCLGDLDGNHSIDFADVEQAAACFGQPAQASCAAADLDGNGIISMRDITSVQRAFGSNACACLGDLDGNHSIDFADLEQAAACFGQPAQASCAAADLDGNGIISMRDITSVQLAFGSNACAL